MRKRERKLSEADMALLTKFAMESPVIPVMQKKRNGEWFVVTKTERVTGRSLIAKGQNKISGKDIEPRRWYMVTRNCLFDLTRHLKAAFNQGGNDAMVEAYKEFLEMVEIYRAHINKTTLPESKVGNDDTQTIIEAPESQS